MSENHKLIAEHITQLREEIKAEWERAEPVLLQYVADGLYEHEKQYRYRVWRRVERLHEEIIRCKLRLPPFIVEKDGVLCVMPVTDENRHFLSL
jgi:hypothetical protein